MIRCGWGLVAAGAFLVLLLVLIPSQAAAPTAAPQADTYQLLTNPGMERFDPPYARFEGVACQVATGWQRFWYGGPAPCWMDTRVFAASPLGGGWVERIEGETSQMLVATVPYTAGLQQRVTGLTPGVGYGFHAALLTIFQSSAPPAVDGTMIKQIGIDPTGGTDPQAPSVVWTPPNDHDEGPWDIDQRLSLFAQGPSMTVFIRVESPYSSGGLPYMNLSFLDSAILAQTPTIRAISPAETEETSFEVRWDNAEPAPVGGYLRDWHDVQWLDEADGVWHNWFVQTGEESAAFKGEKGHTYRFRARVWQRYPNGAHLTSPWRPEGDSTTHVLGPRVVGVVRSPEGHPVAGATVAIAGTALSAISRPDGQYELAYPADLKGEYSLTLAHPWWDVPAPQHGLLLGVTETVTVDWTALPPVDAVVNGQFEAGLANWTPLNNSQPPPVVVDEPVHTGLGALALGCDAVEEGVGVGQTGVLTNAWEPVLSFWYMPLETGPGDRLEVRLTLVSHVPTFTLPLSQTAALTAPLPAPITATEPITSQVVLTPALDGSGWQHLWAYAGPPDAALTATVDLQFRWIGAGPDSTGRVYIDEVSLGATPGGPFQVHLPLILR